MIVTTGGRGFNVSSASFVSSVWVVAYSSSRTAWKLNAEAISSIMSKSGRWLIVTICPSSLKAKVTICVGGTLRMFASSLTVMNSVTRTSVFSRSFSSWRRASCSSRKLGPSSRRAPLLRPTGPFIVVSVREMFCCTASKSTDFFPFLRFLPPFSRRRSSRGTAPGAAEATGRGGGGTPAPGVALATGRGRTGVGMNGRGDAPAIGRGAAAALRPLLDRDRRGLRGDLHRAAAFRRRGCFLQLALLALPAGAHQRRLLVLERRQVAAHPD